MFALGPIICVSAELLLLTEFSSVPVGPAHPQWHGPISADMSVKLPGKHESTGRKWSTLMCVCADHAVCCTHSANDLKLKI